MALAMTLSLASCSRGCRTTEPPTPESGLFGAPSLKAGQSLFKFDYEAVTELLLVKADPVTGDRWAARLYRPETPPGKRHPGAESWRIERAGGSDLPPLDSRADGYFVLHLLDTLRTLQVERPDVQGPPESLGLASPRFALKWKVGGKEQFELMIGDKADARAAKSEVMAANADPAAPVAEKGAQRAYAQVPGHPPFIIDGASLQMLEYISGFEHLRLKTWAGVVADDIDEIEGPGGFYAQREGADWTDRKHRPFRSDLSPWLERITHERVRTFVDEPNQAERMRKVLSQKPLRQLTLKDRRGNPVQLAIAQIEGRWIAQSSARPGGIFEVYPDAQRALQPPGSRR